MSDGLDPILQQKEQQQLKTQLLWRLGIAATLIAGVLGAIAWFDQASKNGSPKVQITQIAPEASAVAAPTASLIASATVAVASSAAEVTPSAVITTIPTATPTTSPIPALNQTEVQSIGNAPQAKPSKIATTATTSTPVAVNKPTSNAVDAANSTKPIPNTPQPASSKSTPSLIPLSPPRTSQLAPAPTLALTPNAPRDYPAPTVGKQGYSVQAGVFLHSNNAEKLLSQLQQAGIPAYLETRVQIGPFKNKTEADAAVKKLRQLGIEPIIKLE